MTGEEAIAYIEHIPWQGVRLGLERTQELLERLGSPEKELRYINSFGKIAMAGCGAYSKVEGFAALPVTCFSMALTTFISQNLGAGKYDRVRKGARFGVLCGMTLTELIGLVLYVTMPVLISFFNNDPEVIAYGTKQAHIVTPFYFLMAYSHCTAGIMRGAGKSSVPMFVMLLCWCLLRVPYVSLAVHLNPIIDVVFWAYPITWTLSGILFFIYYHRADWMHGLERQKERHYR